MKEFEDAGDGDDAAERTDEVADGQYYAIDLEVGGDWVAGDLPQVEQDGEQGR